MARQLCAVKRRNRHLPHLSRAHRLVSAQMMAAMFCRLLCLFVMVATQCSASNTAAPPEEVSASFAYIHRVLATLTVAARPQEIRCTSSVGIVSNSLTSGVALFDGRYSSTSAAGVVAPLANCTVLLRAPPGSALALSSILFDGEFFVTVYGAFPPLTRSLPHACSHIKGRPIHDCFSSARPPLLFRRRRRALGQPRRAAAVCSGSRTALFATRATAAEHIRIPDDRLGLR